uniref:Uncharacterized protein n=1 Tax=Ackermannviridae sp. ctaCq7 TaxID=2827294 RepID=A0A8S5R5D5_9CAUD|nr:MAG TPA: hypothetical protein [Ackermannviridae sp. ctaCq7]
MSTITHYSLFLFFVITEYKLAWLLHHIFIKLQILFCFFYSIVFISFLNNIS